MAISSIEGLAADLDDASLFAAATAPEAAPEEPAAPAGDGAQPRDELGRFASPPVVTPPQTSEDSPPAEAPPGEPPAREEFVPSWRLREEREAREAYASRLAERDRQLTEALNFIRQNQAPVQPPAPIDPLVDPAAFHRYQADTVAGIRADFQSQLRTLQLENNLQLTRMQDADLFDDAYRAFVETASGDQQFARAIVGAPNPGGAMVNWYRNAVVLNAVGNDPVAWFNGKRAELLQDPEFLREAVEAARNWRPPAAAAAPSSGNMRGAANVVQLPPSLMRMRGGSSSEATAANPGGDDPLSDQSLFAFASAKK
jgi:hypothetical protein